MLLELVLTDLEYRLKGGEPARAEQYLDRFPEFKSDHTAALELIKLELLDSGRREPELTLDEFLERFPDLTQSCAAYGSGSTTQMARSGGRPRCHRSLLIPEVGCFEASPAHIAARRSGLPLPQPGPTRRRRCSKSTRSLKSSAAALRSRLPRHRHRTRPNRRDQDTALRLPRRPRRRLSILREAGVAELQHPHIVPIYDFGRVGKTASSFTPSFRGPRWRSEFLLTD